MRLAWRRVPLRTARPFTISAGTTTTFENLIVELHHDDVVGLGEAAPSRRVTGETLDSGEAFFARVGGDLPEDPDDLLAWLHDVHADAKGDASARAGLDLAVHDLVGKVRGVPARDLLGVPARPIATSMTVSVADPAAMAAEARAYVEAGFHIVKVKLADTARAVEQVRAVRAAAPAARLFVDANQAWTVEETLDVAPALADLGVAFLEQPVAADDLPGLARLSRLATLPVVADESVHDVRDVEALLDLGYTGGVNVKLQKTGGLAPAVEALRRARDAGLPTMCGCNLETGVGIAAGLQLAGLLDEADLDGNLLLAEDPFVTVRPERGVLPPTEGPGLGVRPA